MSGQNEAMADPEQLTEAQRRIFRAFGFSDNETAEIVASAEYQAFRRARAEADEEEAAFVAGAEALAAKLSADLTAKLLENRALEPNPDEQ